MEISILYFSWIKDRVKKSEEKIIIPNNIKSVKELITWLKNKDPSYADAFKNLKQIRVALDQCHVDLSSLIGESKEIAFFPPVTGG